MNSFILHGDICWPADGRLKTMENAYAVCVDGISRGVFPVIPEQYAGLPTEEAAGQLIIPGMVDLHVHAPQYSFNGLGMDLELLDWLKAYAFPEEARYRDIGYAEKAYGLFVRDLQASATTRACIFATVHRDATELLMRMLDATGLSTYVGKINMDRDAPEDLREANAYISAFDTFGWLNDINGKLQYTRPILTPRFLPSCSDTLLNELREVLHAYDLPVQSHLSENPGEVELVKRLFPQAAFYGDGYDAYDMFGSAGKTIMAHCIYSVPEEVECLRKNGVFVAHCPASNMNLCSGIAPVRRYLNRGIRVGLGTDVAGGESLSVFRAIANAIQVSKLYWRLADQNCAPLTFDEALEMATVRGGEFFGKVGSLEEGYEFDAVVIRDESLNSATRRTLHERLERAVYRDATGLITAKYCQGRKVWSV